MKKLLIIVNSRPMEAALRRALGQSYQLDICTDTAEAAALLKPRPDALVLDLYLPGTTGLAFLEQNAGSLPPVILALSPWVTPGAARTAARLGVGRLLRLPCTADMVAKELNALFSAPMA